MTDESIFAAALAIHDPFERAAYLDRACADDWRLRRRIEDLLADRSEENADCRPRVDLSGTGNYTPGSKAPSVANVGDQLGPYRLTELIGEGGMGQVWLALQKEPVKRVVAVKVIKAGMDSKAVLSRFEAERQALALMDHPNIAKVLDAGTTNDGRPYFVMELVKGVPITVYCDDRKLTPKERLELFVPVCQAIQHAHQKGLIHRDIKPSNVLVALYDDRPVPKVIDFGVSKATGMQLTDLSLITGFGAVVGTPEYMSPEQASLNNLDIDTRSDVYSLGVLLYELLTGSTPIDRKSMGKAALLEVLRVVREVEAPRPSTKLSSSDALPSIAANRNTEPAKLSRLMKGELDWIMLKALEKDRARRYESANGFAADLNRYLAGEPVQAVPPSTGYRMKKLLRRNKGQVTTLAFIFLSLLAGTVAATFGLVEARRQRDDANEAREDAKRELQNATNANHALDTSRSELRETNQTLRNSKSELRTTLYAARMNLMRNALDARPVGGIAWSNPFEPGLDDQMLDLTYPDGAVDDPSGFEWHYWDRKLRGYLGKFAFGQLGDSQLSADGARACYAPVRLLGALSDRKGFQVTDTAGGRVLWKIDTPHDGFDFQIGLSPDGTHVAGVGVPTAHATAARTNRKRIQVFEVETGREVARLEKDIPESWMCYGCRLGPDNRTVVAFVIRTTFGEKSQSDSRMIVWDSATGRELFTREFEKDVTVDSWFNTAGTELLVVSSKNGMDPWERTAGSVEILDANSGRTLKAIGSFPNGVTTAAISRDGRWVATAEKHGKSSEVKLWDAASGKEIRPMTVRKRPGRNQMPHFTRLAFSSDGDRLAAACVDVDIDLTNPPGETGCLIWDVPSGDIRCFIPEGNIGASGGMTPLAFGAGNNLVYTGGAMGFIWDGSKDDRAVRNPVKVSVPGMSSVEMICSPNGYQFATLWSNESAGEAEPKAGLAPKLGPMAGPLGGLEIPRRRLPPGADSKLELRVGDATGRDLLRVADLGAKLPAKSDPQAVQMEQSWRHVFFSPDGRRVACLVTHAKGPVEKYYAILKSLNQPDPKDPSGTFFSFPSSELRPDSHPRVQAARKELEKIGKFALRSNVRVWDLATGQELKGLEAVAQYSTPSFLPISDAWFTLDGEQITAIRQPTEPARTEAWFTSDHEQIADNQKPSEGAYKGWVLGGSRVVTWDVGTGLETRSFVRNELLLNQGEYAPDGNTLILAGRFAGRFQRIDSQTGRDLEPIPTGYYSDGTIRMMAENAWGIVGPYDYFDLSTHPQGRIRVSPDRLRVYRLNSKDIDYVEGDAAHEVTLFNGAPASPPSRYRTELVLGQRAIAVSPDGRRVVADGTALNQGKTSNVVVVWDAASGNKLTHIDLPGQVRDLAFSRDSHRLGCLISLDEGRSIEFHLLDGTPWPNRKVFDKLKR